MNEETRSTAHGSPRGTRQTLTYLSQLLASQGLRAKRDLGQNFLIDLNLLDLLVRSSEIDEKDVVLEVGAGTGGLTTRLADRAGRVVSVEVDTGFYGLASNEIAGRENVTLISDDVLARKNKLNPVVMQELQKAMEEVGADHYHIVANFPYDVASSVIANTLLHALPVRSMTFTVQFEVALRIVSRPGNKDYGPLSVLAQTLGDAWIIRTLPPSAFWPRPKVRSAFVRLIVEPGRKDSIPDLAEFHHFVRMLFIHRRKNLRAGILSIPEYKPLKPILADKLVEIGLRRDDRAECIDPPALYRLFQSLQEWLPSSDEEKDRG